MPRIAINLLRWGTAREEIHRCIEAALRSDYADFELIYAENPHPSAPSLIEDVRRSFGADSRLATVRHESNLGYAGAHNRFFAQNRAELLMVLNPDAILDRYFLSRIVAAFDDSTVAAATGKMLKPGNGAAPRLLDGTGIEIFRSRRAWERGQLMPDTRQYDNDLEVFGVSGTAAVYRKSALEAICLGGDEYFDPDFFAYWEDFDLSWRLRLQGYRCVYVPSALVEHERVAGQGPRGLRNLVAFIRHRRSFSRNIRQWSWRNRLFAILKNDFGWSFYRDLPRIVARETALLLFIAVFTPDTLLGIPHALRLLPRMWRKRLAIQASRKIGSAEACAFFR